MSLDPRRALVLFSGGQDSTTCLAWALNRYAHVETIGFDYQQRHIVELESRLAVRAGLQATFPAWHDKLGDDHLIDLSLLGQITDGFDTVLRINKLGSTNPQLGQQAPKATVVIDKVTITEGSPGATTTTGATPTT